MHTIEPGGFDTGITDMGKLGQAMKKAYERAPEELKAVYGGNVSRWCKFRPPDKSAYWKIIFFISHPKHMLSVLKSPVSFEHPKHMLKLINTNIITILH